MTARLLEFSVLGLLFAAISSASYFATRLEYLEALAAFFVIGFGYALVLGLEFLCLVRFGVGDIVPRASGRILVRAWFHEVLCMPLIFGWRQPFRSDAIPDFVPLECAGRRGLVLIHGFLCNRGLWNPWMATLRQREVPFVGLDLEPPWGRIDAFVPTLQDAVERLRAATGVSPVIVAHSMGGLVARAWRAEQCHGGRAPHIVTIGTPHRGTWLGRFGWFPNIRQMRIGSAWLSSLAEREGEACYSSFICFYGNCDNVVFPTSSAILAGADNRHVDETAHLQMVYHPDVMKAVLQLTHMDPARDTSHSCSQSVREPKKWLRESEHVDK